MIRAARAAWFRPVSRWSAPSSDTKLRGCRAARKISLALAMPTVLSVGECMTSSARRRVRICSRRSAARTSSMKCRLRVSALPPIEERRLALGLDPLHQGVVVVLDVAGVVRRPDAGHRRDRRTLVGGGDHGRPAEGVPDEQPHLAARVVHELHRADGVGDLVGERPVAPVALGVAQTEVVEAQHADALAGQLLADPARGRAVLAEGEAVGEDAPAAHLAFGEIDETRQGGSGGAGN